MGAFAEGFVDTGEREIPVLYNNEALGNVEVELNCEILELIKDSHEKNSIGIRRTAILLRAGMETSRRYQRRGKRPISLREAYAVLDEVNFVEVFGQILPLILSATGLGNAADNAEEVDADEEGADDPNG